VDPADARRGGGRGAAGALLLQRRDADPRRARRPGRAVRRGEPISDAETAGGRWVLVHEETFDSLALPAPSWQADTYPDDGPFSDNGAYFQQDGVTPPQAFRATAAFGGDGWLTLEAYSRSSATTISSLAAVEADPGAAGNKALRIASPAHTDATVVRPTQPLPDSYRVSLRVGFADFGDGKDGAATDTTTTRRRSRGSRDRRSPRTASTG